MNGDNWIRYCEILRKRAVKKEKDTKFLLANFSSTEQQKDIEKRTPVINDFFRVKINIKGWNEKEMRKIGMHAADFSSNDAVFQATREEFDIPLWAFFNSPNHPLQDYNNSFIYQLKACNLYCPWCYVDDVNKNGMRDNNSRFFSISEIMGIFEEERKKQPLHLFRPSGGEPTLAVEQWLNCLRELRKRGLEDEVYIQGDTNLTTGHFVQYLEKKSQIEKNLLEKIGEFSNFGLLCSFKGTDTKSFLEASGMNERNSFLEEERWYSLSKLIRAGIEAYPFVYNPSPASLEKFMEKGAKKFGEGFYLKTWITKLKLYGPGKERLKRMLGKDPVTYQEELDEDFTKSKEIMQNLIQKKYGLNYKAIPRTGIKLKVK